MAEIEYPFTFNTPQGPVSFKVPARGMKACPCGCTLFNSAFRIAYVKPAGVVNVPPVCLRVEVYSCKDCGREIGPADPTVGDLAKKAQEPAGIAADVME